MCPKLDKITIPNSVQSIGRQAFGGCSSLKDVIFYEGLESIGHTAFLQCTNLETITIPGSVNEIAPNAFEGCTSLSSVTFDCKPGYEGVKKLIGTFSKCNNLEAITLPNNVEEIRSYTFLQCEKLKSIAFPKSLKSISPYAFQNCYGLEEITIYTSTNISQQAFQGCENIKKINVIGADQNDKERIKIAFKKAIFAPNEVQDLSNDIFEFKKDTSVFVNKSVQRGNTPIQEKTLSTEVIIQEGRTSIAPNEFAGRNVTSVTIPSSMTVIGENAFAGCTSLKKVIVHQKLKEIHPNAFLGCNGVSFDVMYDEKDIPQTDLDTIEAIFNKGFSGYLKRDWKPYDNTNMPAQKAVEQAIITDAKHVLTANVIDDIIKRSGNSSEIVIPEGYTSIASVAFAGRNITSVTIPGSMTVIGENAFTGCTSLKNVVVHQKLKEIHPNAFLGCQGLCFEVMYDKNNLLQVDIDTVEAIFNKGFSGYLKRDWKVK